MSFKPIAMNASRICEGLSKIGYTPASAICDIIDNSVRAEAQHVYVRIEREKNVSDNRLNNVKEYLIIDDGKGMDQDGILSALMLGSPSDNYEQNSLSKFGLGLKSASFSQGEVLEVISSKGGSTRFKKFIVSLNRIREEDQYGAEEAELTEEDQQWIGKFLQQGHGTIVRITAIRKINHPSIKSTLQELQDKAGTIYYYMLKDAIHLEVNSIKIEPFDVLFVDEANENGNLDENTWDGRTTRWIEKPRKITVDGERNVTMTVEVTQLPHPPTFKPDGDTKQAEIRKKYHIEAGNYGFYVYRNGRLLSWAESFGIIPQDQDFYAFRGRIIIDSSADEIFNLDVKKSQIHLSDEAFRTLEDISAEYKRKSKKAWERAKTELKRKYDSEGLPRANALAQKVELPDELPGAPDTEEAYAESEQREQEIVQEQQERIQKLVQQFIEEEALPDEVGEPLSPDEKEPTPEQIQSVVAGETSSQTDRIFLVKNTEDNVLWEPYYDTDQGNCVRLNRLHRFARVIYDDNSNNSALHIFTGLLLLQLAEAEAYVQRKYQKYERKVIEDILQEYRRVSTEFLAQLCRDIGDELPSD